MDEFHQAVKTDELSEVVVLRPKLELCSSYLIGEAVFNETKAALNDRSRSSILKNPSDPYYHLVKMWCVIIHRLFYLLIEVYIMKLTWFLDPNTGYTAVALTKGEM